VSWKTHLFWSIRRRLPRSLSGVAICLLSYFDALWSRSARQVLGKRLSSQLAQILAQHREAQDIILFAPSVHWNLSLFQRPHQLALAFARRGSLVFFCEPRYSFDYAAGFYPIRQRLYVAKVPLEIFHAVESPIVFFLSYNLADLSGLCRPRCVYDYLDELDIFPGDRQSLEQDHHHLLNTATLVVATADRLWRQVRSVRDDALLCPNAVDYHFVRCALESVHQPPDDLASLLKPTTPVIGYYGALAEWFDYDLLLYAAAERPAYEFVLIGPDYDGSLTKSRIHRQRNIHWLGIRPYAQLPQYLKYFDVATIPFRLNQITHSTSPIKLFEYMAARKPVVTTAMHESSRYAGVVVAKGPKDFVRKLDAALQLRSDATYLSVVDRLARENTWDARAQQILEALPLSERREHA